MRSKLKDINRVPLIEFDSHINRENLSHMSVPVVGSLGVGQYRLDRAIGLGFAVD